MTEQKVDLNLFFPTPVWASIINNYKHVNQKIFSYIDELKTNDPEGVRRSNFKGWHSKDFELNNENVIIFVNAISTKLNKALIDMNWDLKNQTVKITSMWSIINQKHALNERHIHGNNFISGAYYVKAPSDCGNICFYDPRSGPTFSHPKTTGPNKLNATVHSIKPEDGLLVLFPSYLHHSVETNLSDEERVVISFNVNLISN